MPEAAHPLIIRRRDLFNPLAENTHKFNANARNALGFVNDATHGLAFFLLPLRPAAVVDVTVMIAARRHRNLRQPQCGDATGGARKVCRVNVNMPHHHQH